MLEKCRNHNNNNKNNHNNSNNPLTSRRTDGDKKDLKHNCSCLFGNNLETFVLEATQAMSNKIHLNVEASVLLEQLTSCERVAGPFSLVTTPPPPHSVNVASPIVITPGRQQSKSTQSAVQASRVRGCQVGFFKLQSNNY